MELFNMYLDLFLASNIGLPATQSCFLGTGTNSRLLLLAASQFKIPISVLEEFMLAVLITILKAQEFSTT